MTYGGRLNMKKNILILFCLLLLAVTMAACSGNESGNTEEINSEEPQGNNENVEENAGNVEESGESKTIKAGIGLNEEHPQYKGMELFKEIVETETDGAIKVEIYPSAQLGDDKQMIQAVQLGTQEVTVPATAPLANFVPEFNILNFPFLFPNEEVADAVLDGEVGQMLLDKLEDHGMVGLSYWEEGFYNISNNVRPIETADDLDGIRIRTMENEILLDIFKALGANPTPMAFSEVYTALQQGVVDAQTNPVSQIYEAKFHEVQKYVSGTNDYYGAWVFLINKEFFDGLTPEQQEIVRKASIEARDLERKLTRESEQEYLEKIQADGVEYNDLTEKGRKSIQEKIQPVIDEYAKEIQDVADAFFEAIEAEQNK